MASEALTDEQKLAKAVKAKWLNALRSGKYQQGKEELGSAKKGYCCMGVFCVANRIRFKSTDTGNLTGPKKLLNAMSKKTRNVLWQMNDEDEKSFAQIADWIEVNL